jgi:hypothetical protein
MTDERIETGALQIDDDWTGLFVRGDDAFQLRDLLYKIYIGKQKIDNFDLGQLSRYIAIIELDVKHVQYSNQKVQRIKTK